MGVAVVMFSLRKVVGTLFLNGGRKMREHHALNIAHDPGCQKSMMMNCRCRRMGQRSSEAWYGPLTRLMRNPMKIQLCYKMGLGLRLGKKRPIQQLVEAWT